MIAPPGIPNITSTPSASSERRIASAPFIFIVLSFGLTVPRPFSGRQGGDRAVSVAFLHWRATGARATSP